MYLPSLKELNKNAVQQKAIDEDDDRLKKNKNSADSSACNSKSESGNIIINPQDKEDFDKKNQIGMRKDRYGNDIRIGHKKHKITFRDQVQKGEDLSDVVFVESYKKYNQLDNDDSGGFSCRCIIF